MNGQTGDEIVLGAYSGRVAERWRAPDTLAFLERIADGLHGPDVETLGFGRDHSVKLQLPCHGGLLPVVVKAFGRQPFVKDLIDHGYGSKARRQWQVAEGLREAAIGTPPPVAFLERWRGGRLLESYFIAEYLIGTRSFKQELIRLFRHNPECARFMDLLQTVARAIRRMHDAGFQHNDLGNQNILVRRDGDDRWGDVAFVDLNRMRDRGLLTEEQKGRDISRIHLPSDLLRVFLEMYSDAVPSPELLKWERFHRRLYAWHCDTRWLRHPVRALSRKPEPEEETYPGDKDLWIWDERSGQAIATMRPRDRSRLYPISRHLKTAGAATAIGPVWKEYKRLRRDAYMQPVSLKERIGLSLKPREDTVDRELALLAPLGRIPVLIRFYHHEGPERLSFLAGIVRRLRDEGHPVAIALVQDRTAVRDAARWRGFVAAVLEMTARHVDWVEVGHAVNRVKWGIWDFGEYRRMLEAVADVTKSHPGLRLMGPAAMDFEYLSVVAALRSVPDSLHFSALSHALYVDRRGAPENRQGPFSALEKFALARAVARWSGRTDDRLIVSEVNWPLKGTGVYSPVTSPYESPGQRFNDPSVSEDDYADFMLRYLVIALCSGLVERVYWWRLVARGFGLVDDTEADAWRERPAYRTLRQFVTLLGDARFVRKIPAGDQAECFVFDRGTKGRAALLYSPRGQVEIDSPVSFTTIVDAVGREVESPADRRLTVSGRPLYLLDERETGSAG